MGFWISLGSSSLDFCWVFFIFFGSSLGSSSLLVCGVGYHGGWVVMCLIWVF